MSQLQKTEVVYHSCHSRGLSGEAFAETEGGNPGQLHTEVIPAEAGIQQHRKVIMK